MRVRIHIETWGTFTVEAESVEAAAAPFRRKFGPAVTATEAPTPRQYSDTEMAALEEAEPATETAE